VSSRLLVGRLDLESLRLSPTTSPLELPALASDVRLTALERSTEVLDGLTNVPLSSEEDSVRTGRGTERELVEGDSLTAGSDNSLTSRGREFESGNGEFGDLWETLVVENGTDSDDGLGVVRVGSTGLLDNSGDGDRGSVDLSLDNALNRG
jgi:hypothetical protein